jgi:serine/threonine protein kinase
MLAIVAVGRSFFELCRCVIVLKSKDVFASFARMKELSLENCRLDKRYDVRERLGRGSYAEVFLARDTFASERSPHNDVVIKALNVFLQDDLDDDLERTLVENFQNEAIALDRVRHPNIISRLGHGTARDLHNCIFHYLVLEYLPGGDLQALVRSRKPSLKQAMNYVEQICAGLGHAHACGIIHRDIKPQNLLLTADHATAKIADFGVARVQLNDAPITRVGTNIYAPPEHSPMMAGQTGALDFGQLTPAADIYSLAKTVYMITTGESPRPFANEPNTRLPETTQHEEWADELRRVLQKATLSDPRRRHQSVEDFWNDLAVVREIATDREDETVIRRHSVPQAHVARGYTPFAPRQPQFEPEAPEAGGGATVALNPAARNTLRANANSIFAADYSPPVGNEAAPMPTVVKYDARRKKHSRVRRLTVVAVFFLVFIGVLYGTASYMRGRGVLPEIRNPFRTQTATANTDIYLRPSPSTDNDPVGLVTKNSKVRIVNSQNNWYQVDVIEQGRNRNASVPATRGWLNGKYLDLD